MAKASIRQGIYRVLSDLVKSDNVITIDELNALDEACEKVFSISDQDREEGFRKTLGDALDAIGKESDRLKKKVIAAMENIALKDGECCRAESLLITSAVYVLRNPKAAKVVSIEFKNRPLLSTQLLYVENKKTIAGRAALDTAFGELSQIVKMGGLDLIYIPRVAKDFRDYETGKDADRRRNDMKRVLRLVSPTSGDGDLENTITAIQGMSSRYFYNTILNGRLEMGLDVTEPVWMLRLPDSVVAGKGYANFLCFEVERDVRVQLQEFVEEINSRQNAYSITINDGRSREDRFMYNGFYKALLDVMSVRKEDNWDLCVRLYGDGVPAFEYEDRETGVRKKCALTVRRGYEEYPVPLTGRDLAFYLLLLCGSVSAERGVRFGTDDIKEIGKERGDRIRERIERTNKRYGDIYSRVSRREKKNGKGFPDVWEPKNRIPMRSRVLKEFNRSELARYSSLLSVYLPEENERGLLSVRLAPERIVVVSESETGTKTQTLTESVLYRSCFLGH